MILIEFKYDRFQPIIPKNRINSVQDIKILNISSMAEYVHRYLSIGNQHRYTRDACQCQRQQHY